MRKTTSPTTVLARRRLASATRSERSDSQSVSIMPVLIDGYNLMYAAGLISRGLGPESLARARSALLNFVAMSLPEAELAGSVVVFDSSQAPAGLPQTSRHRGLLVQFATHYEDADALIEELIRQCSAPKRLTVVSSDHRLQRAARRRRAKAVNSDTWFASVVEGRRCCERRPVKRRPSRGRRWRRMKSPTGCTNSPTRWRKTRRKWKHWKRTPIARSPMRRPHRSKRPRKSETAEDSGDPFPPGYFDDLFDDSD